MGLWSQAIFRHDYRSKLQDPYMKAATPPKPLKPRKHRNPLPPSPNRKRGDFAKVTDVANRQVVANPNVDAVLVLACFLAAIVFKPEPQPRRAGRGEARYLTREAKQSPPFCRSQREAWHGCGFANPSPWLLSAGRLLALP